MNYDREGFGLIPDSLKEKVDFPRHQATCWYDPSRRRQTKNSPIGSDVDIHPAAYPKPAKGFIHRLLGLFTRNTSTGRNRATGG